jgi:phosphoserine aminotransferase
VNKHNFYSGPAVLPSEVLEQVQQALVDFAGTGLSILEVSHRSPSFVAVMDSARALARDLMGLDDAYEILWLHGGGNTQFSMIPMNLLHPHATAGYFDTGIWARSAMEEAQSFGQVQVIASSRASSYDHIPQDWDIGSTPLSYAHITTNNTVYGTQWRLSDIDRLKSLVPYMVADMSSDIFSRDIDYSGFGLIYACAQKNLGAAGVTIVAIRRDILATMPRPIPTMSDYRVHIAHGSMRNTPSVFAVYVAYLTLQWIKRTGLDTIAIRNQRKATKLYAAIDASSIFKGMVQPAYRSGMNVCFTTGDSTYDTRFSDYVKPYGIIGIEGYRLVGGFRASIYNALPEASVDVLIAAMLDFEASL